MSGEVRALYRELCAARDEHSAMQHAANHGAIARGCYLGREFNPFDGKHEFASESLAYAWDTGWREADFVARARGLAA